MKKLLICIILILSSCNRANPEIKNLTSGPSAFPGPKWAPDSSEVIGTTINLSRQKYQIFSFNILTSKKRLLFENRNVISAEAWSPDGQEILFSSISGDDLQIGLLSQVMIFK